MTHDRFNLRFDRPSSAGENFSFERLDFAQQARAVLGPRRELAEPFDPRELLAHAVPYEPANEGVGAGRQFLLEHADSQLCRPFDPAFVGFDALHHQFQRRRFSGAVAPDQAHPLARLDREIGFVKDLLIAKRQRNCVETDERCHK